MAQYLPSRLMLPSTARQTLRLRDFELDVEAYQLRRQGRPIRLERRPMELLILLVEQHGRLVSRSDIAERLWGKDVFVDVETGVNIAIRKIRQALRDSAEKPAFVETVVERAIDSLPPSRLCRVPPRLARPGHPSNSQKAQRRRHHRTWVCTLSATVSCRPAVRGLSGSSRARCSPG
jgi:hypothetical protein